jgi:glycosyltransferase involved in cell wall biosynthesis
MSLRFSIITAVRNRVGTIASTMASVHAQSWPELEHIVVDGGSTDGTLAVLEQYRSSIAQLIGGPDQGVYDALNKGLRHVTGDVVGFMHSDDEYASPDVLAKVAAAFEDPSVNAVYGDLVYVSQRDPSHVVRYWRAGAYSRAKLASGWMPPHPTLYVRRELYDRFGGFDTRYRIAADYECMLRLLWKHGIRPVYIPEVMVRMRTGGMSNASLFTMLRKSFEDFTALRQNQLGGVKALLLKNMTKLPQFVAREPLGLSAAPRRSV